MRRSARPGALLAVTATVAVLAACGGNVTETTTTTAETTPSNASMQRGARLFTATCASCHALAAAHSTATIGPSLDYVMPTVEQVEGTVAEGMRGATAVMPAGLLRGQDAADVAAYIAAVADRRVVRPNPLNHRAMDHP